MNTADRNQTVTSVIKAVLKEHAGVTCALVIAAAGSVLAGLLPPRILKNIIDTYIGTGGIRQALVHIALVYFASYVLIALLDVIKETILAAAGQKITVKLRNAMMEKMQRLPALYFTAHETGATVSRITNDVDAIQALFTNGIVGMIVDLFRIVGIVISMWLFSPVLGIFMAAVLPLLWFLTRFFQKRMLGAQVQNRIIISRVNAFVPETVRSIRMIHSFGKEDYMQSHYEDILKDSYDAVEKVNWYDSVFSPVIRVICALVISAVSLLASSGLPFAVITAGMAAASIQYIIDIFTPVGNLGMELQSIQTAVAGIQRVDQFFAEPEDASKDEKAGSFILAGIAEGRKPVIELEHVTFAYSTGRNIIDDVSLIIKDEQKVTFTGRTGAGKSTLFRLIPGLLVPVSGRVLVNGTDVSVIPNSVKRRLFGYVAQHFEFINGTIRDQIQMHDVSVSDHDVENALKLTGMYDYVQSLEQGLETPAAAALFSQGQMQLLAVARAVVTDPPVLLLDEVTANLDSETEQQLLTVLENVSQGRIVLSVAHRHAAVSAGTRILRVADGKVTEAAVSI